MRGVVGSPGRRNGVHGPSGSVSAGHSHEPDVAGVRQNFMDSVAGNEDRNEKLPR